MANLSSEDFKKFGRIMLLLAILYFIIFLTSNFLGLSATGFQSSEILGIQTFYVIFGVIGFIILCSAGYSIFIKDKDNEYGNSVGFDSLGETPHWKALKRFTLPQISLLTFILVTGLYLGLSIVSGTTQTTYTGVPSLTTSQQQFTPLQNTVYGLLIGPGSENLGAAALIAIIMVGLGFFARKFKWDKPLYLMILVILLFFLVGLYGVGDHQLRYAGQELSLWVVFFFWGIGGMITGLTGCFIIFWIIHEINNGFYELNFLFPNINEDTVRLIVFGIIVLSTVLYFVVYWGRLLGDKNRIRSV